jgi:hypothetical protein
MIALRKTPLDMDYLQDCQRRFHSVMREVPPRGKTET